MKRFLFLTVVVCGLLAFAVPGGAVTINGGTNVGSLDTLVDSTELANSGFATELAWVQSFVPGATITVFAGGVYTWVEADGVNDIWVTPLQDSPNYFFLKTGAAPGTDDHYLFQNFDLKSYGVVDFGPLAIKNIGAISHIGESGGTTQVPEGSTLMLLGFGLAGVGMLRRFMGR